MISVLIVNFYSAKLTKRAVDSVFEYAEDVEVIVVDNTTTTEEKILLEDLLDTRDIRLIFNPKNEGFARACNQAFIISRGEHILLLDPDAYIIPSCLNILKTFLENTSDAGAISPQVYWDDDMKYYFPLYPSPSPSSDFLDRASGYSKRLRKFYSLHVRKKNLMLWRASVPAMVKNLSGGIVMLKRSAIQRAGGLFDERFFLFYEDTDLFLRLRKSGYNLYIAPDARAVHNYSYTNTDRKPDFMEQSYYIYFKKHFNRSLLRKITSIIPGHRDKNEYADNGSWNSTPWFSVPSGLRKGYLFEWSPNPMFIPAVGYFGSGDTFVFSEQIWNLIDTGTYYSRFTDPRENLSNFDILRWRKK